MNYNNNDVNKAKKLIKRFANNLYIPNVFLLNTCKKIVAFTLAEVLITLLIIGVVASLVVPGIINSTNEAEYNAGVKKVYADLSQALGMIVVNNSGTVHVGTIAANADMSLVRNDFCNVMSCVKTDISANIFADDYRRYKGGSAEWPSSEPNGTAAMTNNGYLIRFHSYTDCTTSSNGVNECGVLNVDINGKKGPNMEGKDFYDFWIVRKNGTGAYQILPFGTQGDNANGCATGASGTTGWHTSGGCTAQRLNDPIHMP